MTGLASRSVEALLRSRDSTGRTEPVEVHTDALDHSDLGPRQRARGTAGAGIPASPPALQRPEIELGALQGEVRRPALTDHTLHLLGDVILSVTVGGLSLCDGLSGILDGML